MLKQLLIPLAAFAVTVTGVSAWTGGDILAKLDLDLSDTQVAALEEAHQIREEAQARAKEVLEQAGIDEVTMREVHNAMRGEMHKSHEAIKSAVEANDYAAFQAAVADSPLAESVDTAEKFARFVDAHKLMESGDREGAQAIFEALGIERGPMGDKGKHGGLHDGGPFHANRGEDR